MRRRSWRIRRGDPMWQLAYGRAAMQSDSGLSLRNETNWYHGGDRMIATDLDAQAVSFLPGMALVGDAKWTDVHGVNVRLANGTIATTNQATSSPALPALPSNWAATANSSCKAWSAMTSTGAQAGALFRQPNSFGFVNVNYHQPYVDTPTAVDYRADTDNATIGYTQHAAGRACGAAWPATTPAMACMATPMWRAPPAGTPTCAGTLPIWGGLLAGISYDGHGEYRHQQRHPHRRRRPRPFVPLGIRNMENHAVTANLSSFLGNGFWFAAYAGWVVDRYAADGLLAGLDLHYTPAAGRGPGAGRAPVGGVLHAGRARQPADRRPEPDGGHGRAAPAELDAERALSHVIKPNVSAALAWRLTWTRLRRCWRWGWT